MLKERIKEKVRFLSAKRFAPLLTDHRMDVMAMTMWLLYGTWGILSTLAGVTILKDIADVYPILWGAAIGLSALAALISSFNTFMAAPQSVAARIKWKRREMIAVSLMLGFIAIYPVLMFVSLFNGNPRPDLLVLSLSYLVVPWWRVGHLASRIAQLRVIGGKHA